MLGYWGLAWATANRLMREEREQKERKMRLDAINDSNNPLNREAKVLLDGVEQHDVTVADEEAGFIERYVKDADGNIVISDGRAQTERLSGVVRIVLPEVGSDS